MMAILRILFIGENLSRAGEPPTLQETAAESNSGGNRMHRFSPSNQSQLCDCGIKAADLGSDRKTKKEPAFFVLTSVYSVFLILNFSSAYENSSRWYFRRNRHVHLDVNRAHGIAPGRSRSRRNPK